jgi:hypothetical protein
MNHWNHKESHIKTSTSTVLDSRPNDPTYAVSVPSTWILALTAAIIIQRAVVTVNHKGDAFNAPTIRVTLASLAMISTLISQTRNQPEAVPNGRLEKLAAHLPAGIWMCEAL